MGVAVLQTQSESETQSGWRQSPPEQVMSLGQSALVVQTSLHFGTGVAVGVGVGVAVGVAVAPKVIVRLQVLVVAGVGLGEACWAAGRLSGAVGATACCRSW